MRGRLAHWLRPPPAHAAADRLRWVARLAIVIGVLGLANALIHWVETERTPWIQLVAALLMLSTPLTLRPAIARASSEGPPPAAELPRRRRRGDIAMYVISGALCVVMPITGYLLDGVGGAAFFLVGALSSAGLSFWLWRRYLRP